MDYKRNIFAYRIHGRCRLNGANGRLNLPDTCNYVLIKGALMDKDLEYVQKIMVELIGIPSCGGYSSGAIERVRREFESFGVETELTNKGALIAKLPGKSDKRAVMLSGHVDTLAAMVKDIKDNGRLRLTNIGGYAWGAYEAENATVKTMSGKDYSGVLLPDKASVHIFSDEAREAPRTEDTMELRLDENVKTRADTQALGIAVGDFVFFDPKTQILDNGYIKSRYLDDKACVAVLLGAVKHLRENRILPSYTTYIYISNYEEIGHGVSVLPEKVDEFLALDIGTVGPGHTSDEHCVTIVAKDSRTPYDYEFRRRLTEMAIAGKIDYRVDVHYRYGSDSSMGALAGFNFNFACVGPGVDATHHYERTHRDALENTLSLVLRYICA